MEEWNPEKYPGDAAAALKVGEAFSKGKEFARSL